MSRKELALIEDEGFVGVMVARKKFKQKKMIH